MKDKLKVVLLFISITLAFIAIAYLAVATAKWDPLWIAHADTDFRVLFIICVVSFFLVLVGCASS